MQIFVKPYDRTLTLDVRQSDTVAIVKSMIQNRTADMIIHGEHNLAYKMSLAYAGKPLARDYRTLADYGVQNLATLTFGINVSAKPPPPGSRHVLCLQYPADRKAFSSDCFYEVWGTDTVRDLKRMVLAKEGITITGIFTTQCDLRNDNRQLVDILWDHATDKMLATLIVTHFSRRAPVSKNLTRLATDLLREVLAYSDFGMVSAGAATCRALRDAVPLKLTLALVLVRFPIISTVADAFKAFTAPGPSARFLFESQARLFDAAPPTVAPTRSMDQYVFSLELRVGTSSYVGTGVARDNATEAQIRFEIPKALWVASEAQSLGALDVGITANIMATRRGTLRRAALYSGGVEDGNDSSLDFEWYPIPCGQVPVEWIKDAVGYNNVAYKPLIFLEWVAPATAAGTSGLSAKFRWDSDDDIIDMSLEDACLVLEHWCKT